MGDDEGGDLGIDIPIDDIGIERNGHEIELFVDLATCLIYE